MRVRARMRTRALAAGRRPAHGQAAIVLVLVSTMIVTVTLTVFDLSMFFVARRAAQSLADGAARAAATEVDLDLLRDSDGATLRLDPTTAADAARDYLARAEAEYDIAVTPEAATVVVRRPFRSLLLRVAGVTSVPGTATARPIHGIDVGARP